MSASYAAVASGLFGGARSRSRLVGGMVVLGSWLAVEAADSVLVHSKVSEGVHA
jgi:hypothetical protein